MTRYLILSWCLLLFACGSYPKKSGLAPFDSGKDSIENPYFANSNQDYVYKAQIEVYGHHLGGLFIVKKLGKDHHRVAFTTEMGNKLFDFSFEEDTFKVNYIMEDLNKKMLINLLKEDFSVLIKEKLPVLQSFSYNNNSVFETSISNQPYYYYYQNETLQQIVKTKRGKEKTSFLFQEISDNIAALITIKHQSIKLFIQLKSISNP